MKFIFWKAHDKSYPNIQLLSVLEKYFKSYGNINVIWPLFGMAFYEIWPCQVTQAKNMSFPYLKSYCPLNFKKSHENLWFCCTPNGSYKEDNLKEGRIFMPPPPPPLSGIGLSEKKKLLCEGLKPKTLTVLVIPVPMSCILYHVAMVLFPIKPHQKSWVVIQHSPYSVLLLTKNLGKTLFINSPPTDDINWHHRFSGLLFHKNL